MKKIRKGTSRVILVHREGENNSLSFINVKEKGEATPFQQVKQTFSKNRLQKGEHIYTQRKYKNKYMTRENGRWKRVYTIRYYTRKTY